MQRAAFIAAIGAALVAVGGGAGSPLPIDRPAPEAAIFYYAWYGTPGVDGAWLHWGQGEHEPPAAIGSTYYPARGPYSSGDPVRRPRPDAGDRGGGNRHRVVSWWGPGLDRGRPASACRRGRARRRPRRRAARGAVGRPNPGHASRGADAPSAASAFATCTSTTRRTSPTRNGAPLSQASRACASSRTRRCPGKAREGRLPGALHLRRARATTGERSAGCVRAPAGWASPARRRSGPGFDASRATGEARVRERNDGRWYDHMWRRRSGRRPTSSRSRATTSGTRARRSSPCRPRRGPYATYDGAWGLTGPCARSARISTARRTGSTG